MTGTHNAPVYSFSSLSVRFILCSFGIVTA